MHKILLADDDEYCASLLKHFLTAKGYDVTHVKDGGEAITAATQEEPDLIILDIMMPAYTGIEVAKILRGQESLKKVPIILLSSLSEESSISEAARDFVDCYLTKPFDPQEVLAQIEMRLEQK
jgi:DNA-binding response OmpR family regulator